MQSEGLRLAREHTLLTPLLRGLFTYGVTLTGKGDYDGALAALEEGITLTEKAGDESTNHRVLNTLGWLYLELGGLDRAFDLNRQAAEGARKRRDPEVLAHAELNLGDAFLAQGDLAAAQEVLEGVHRLVKDPATSDWLKWRYSTHLFASLGELWLVRGKPAKARDFMEQCLEIATRTNSRKYLVRGWRLKGQIALAGHQRDEAERWLRQALTLAETIGNPTQLWETHLALGRLHAEAKRPGAARQAYIAARGVVDGMKLGVKNPDLRANLEDSPIFRQVYELSASG